MIVATALLASACGPVRDGDVDLDQDGWTTTDGDCDDHNHRAHPGADETCDGQDTDCAGEGDVDAIDAIIAYPDADGDGFGATSHPTAVCPWTPGYVDREGDCDDRDPEVHEGAAERCNGKNDDCDASTDEDAIDGAVWYRDADGDGWGDAEDSWRACGNASYGGVSRAGDCDDAERGTYPGAPEYCNGVDEDCDGLIDEDAWGADVWYRDADGDGWGGEPLAPSSCEQPSGTEAQGGDCDDGDPAVHPDATEDCNGIDDDCDGEVDESGLVGTTWYADADGDGYGDPDAGLVPCGSTDGLVLDASDCDDGDPAIHPEAEDLCDGVDDDCDGADEGCEICDNGLDDDGNGLLDCEDARCAEDAACLELICDDGVDDDGDGLVDCADDDCWGPSCHPAGARSRVHDASAVSWYRATTRREGSTCWDYGGGGRESYQARLYGIAGTVQVLPSGAGSWSATTARTTCSWRIATASVALEEWHARSSHGAMWGFSFSIPIQRAGLEVEPGCRLGTEGWFLPGAVWLGASRGYAGYSVHTTYIWPSARWGVPGAPWYRPDSPLASSRGRSSYEAHSVACWNQERSRHWTWISYAGLESGSSYQVSP